VSTNCHATERPHVAVGATRPAAAAVFGPDHDRLDLTDYAAFEMGPEPSTYASVSIAAGDGQWRVLQTVCSALARPNAPAVVLEYPLDVPGREAVRETLAAHPAVVVTDVRTSRGSVLLGLSGPTAGTDSLPHTALLQALDLLPPAAVVASVDAAPRTKAADRTTVPPAATPRTGRLVERVSRLFGASGRRGRLLTLAALGLVALAVLIAVLALIGTSSLGAMGVVVALLMLVLLSVGAVGATVFLALAAVQRRQQDQYALQRRTRGLLDRRTTRLLAQYRSPELRNPDLAAVRRYAAEIARENTRSVSRQQQLHLDTQRQLQAALNMLQLVRLDAAVPAMGGTEASPDWNLLIMDTLLQRRPATVVQTGSGASTLFLALTAVQHELTTRIVTLEHDAVAQASTQALLARHGVTDRAEVRLTRMVTRDVEGHDTRWYEESDLADLEEIGVLVVSDRPSAIGRPASYPAVAQLRGSSLPCAPWFSTTWWTSPTPSSPGCGKSSCLTSRSRLYRPPTGRSLC